MLRKIILHGHLAEKYSEVISVEAETIAEALQSLTLYPELAHPPGQPWPVRIDGVETAEDLYAITPIREIHVYPETGGAGGGSGKGGLQIILGIALIALSFAIPAAGIQLMAGMSIQAGSVFMAGAMMALGGLIQMMMPMPEKSETSPSSRIGSGAGNTTKMGTPIPLAYGTQLLSGHFLSYNVDATEWSGNENDLQLDEKGARFIQSYLPERSSSVGVYPLPGASNGNAPRQGIYAEVDKPTVPYAIVNPVFQSQTTSPTNIPTSSWVV